jgi:transposase
MVLSSVQGTDVAQIAKVTFTSPDRVREVINNFNEDGFESLYAKYAGGRPPTFTLPQRQQIKKIALSRKRWRCLFVDEIDQVVAADKASSWGTADNYNYSHPFPAIDEVTIAIIPGAGLQAS